eukprot:TRINITY_DN114412_c0_g1_i1.p1 TRINITY_DN114412_c0_g1~~TRINITY_DN114412_c0_g1_i1.p1  ORF type:complete len:370 (-),score=56.36 TRINITY_DN114412_c0_g1_i1:136-1116(-)
MDIPPARYFHGSASTYGNVYIFGGMIFTGGRYKAVNDMWKWTNGTGWRKIAQVGGRPPARGYTSLTAMNSTHLLLFGGQKQKYPSYMGDTWIFNAKTEKWTQMQPIVSPTARSYHAATQADGNVWIFGGAILSATAVVNDVWFYNAKANNWTQVFANRAPTAGYPKPRQGHKMATVGSSSILMYGGRGGKLKGGYSDAWTLDTRTKKWAPIKASGGPPRSAFSMVWCERTYAAYIFAGSYIGTKPPYSETYHNDVWKLAPTGFGANKPWKWTELEGDDSNSGDAHHPWKRKGHSAELSSDKTFLMFGGYGVYQGLKQDTWLYHTEF